MKNFTAEGGRKFSLFERFANGKPLFLEGLIQILERVMQILEGVIQFLRRSRAKKNEGGGQKNHFLIVLQRGIIIFIRAPQAREKKGYLESDFFGPESEK